MHCRWWCTAGGDAPQVLMCQSRNRYRKNLVPEKVPVSVSEIFGTGKKYRYLYRWKFWVPSHTGGVVGYARIYVRSVFELFKDGGISHSPCNWLNQPYLEDRQAYAHACKHMLPVISDGHRCVKLVSVWSFLHTCHLWCFWGKFGNFWGNFWHFLGAFWCTFGAICGPQKKKNYVYFSFQTILSTLFFHENFHFFWLGRQKGCLIPSWIDNLLTPNLCSVCFITFLTIYQGKFSFGQFCTKSYHLSSY